MINSRWFNFIHPLKQLVSIMMVLAMTFPFASLVGAVPSPPAIIEVGSATGNPGDTVDVAVYIDPKDYIGLQYDMTVSYDTTVLEPVKDSDNNDVWYNTDTVGQDQNINTSSGTIHITTATLIFDEKTYLFTLHFKIKDNAAIGSSTVNISDYTITGGYTNDPNPTVLMPQTDPTAQVVPGSVTVGLSNQSPVASNAAIGGSLKVGHTLTGTYDYNDADSDHEGQSLYKWYTADDASGTNKTEIVDGVDATFVPRASQVNKYLIFEVKPVAQTGVMVGTAAYSNAAGPIAAADTVTVEIGSVSGKPGRTVEVPISITVATAPIGSYGLQVHFDANELELTKLTDEFTATVTDTTYTVSGSTYDNTQGWFKLGWADEGHPISAGKKLYTATFKIKQGAAIGDKPLTVEENDPLQFTVTDTDAAELDKTIQEGKVTVLSKSSDASLSAISLTGGNGTAVSLLEPFQSSTIQYTASVPNNVDSITVTPTVSDADATITVNTASVASGTASEPISLTEGENTITVHVTAEDGSSDMTYTLKVTRSALGSAALTATAGDGKASLQWTGVQGSVSYAVYQGTAAGQYSGTATTVSGSANTYEAMGLTNGTTYYFMVKAVNGSGSTSDSNVVTVTPLSGNTNLSGLAVSGAALSPAFDPATVSYTAGVGNSTESATITASVSDPAATLKMNGNAAVSGQASAPIALTVGGNTVTLEVTAQNGTVKSYTVTINRASRSSRPSTGSTGQTGGQTPTQASFPVIVNGQKQDQIATGTVTKEGDRTVVTANVDAGKLADQLAKEGTKPVIVVPVTSAADKVTAVLTGDAVKSMENKQAVLEVQTPVGNYKLPAAEIVIDRLASQLGEKVSLVDIVVHVEIAKSDASTSAIMQSNADKGSYTVVAAPVEFTVTATYNGKTVEVDKFNAYVEREIPIPSNVDPSKVTTALVLEKDGTVRHVPTYVTQRDGQYYAVVNSLTNSVYSLVWHPVSFADVETHWSKNAVNDMASRMVVQGVDTAHYQPDASITRAQFAAIIVRALGLADNGTNAAFSDVKSSDWFNGAVAKAQEYGIINGYEDGTFRPDKTITREEAMVVLVRAMKLAGLETDVDAASANKALSAFSDGGSFGDWSKAAAAAAVNNQLVGGSASGLMPKNDITRGETAAIVERMLVKAHLIETESAN